MPKPTKRERRERLQKLMHEYRASQRCFRVVKITGNEVVFHIEGDTIEFLLREGRLTRGPTTNRYLSDDDWAFLFTLAEELMQAAFNGYKKAPKEAPSTSTSPQLSFKFYE